MEEKHQHDIYFMHRTLQTLLNKRLRFKFNLWDRPEHEDFNPDPKLQNEGGSR